MIKCLGDGDGVYNVCPAGSPFPLFSRHNLNLLFFFFHKLISNSISTQNFFISLHIVTGTALPTASQSTPTLVHQQQKLFDPPSILMMVSLLWFYIGENTINLVSINNLVFSLLPHPGLTHLFSLATVCQVS